MDKKAISQLISVLLLVGLSVVLIATITVWGKNLIDLAIKSSEESLNQLEIERKVELSLNSAAFFQPQAVSQKSAVLDSSQPISQVEKTVVFEITNLADLTVDSFKIDLYKKDGERVVIEGSLTADLKPYETKELSFSYNEEDEDYFQITPIIQNKIIQQKGIKFTPN